KAQKYIPIRAEEDPKLSVVELKLVDPSESLGIRLPKDVVFELVDEVVELFQHGEGSVDERIDHEVGDEGRLAMSQLGALVNSVLEVLQLRRRLVVHGDQVVRADEQMVLAQKDLVPLPLGDEEHREVVVGVLVHLRSLVLVPDVLDGQGMELERLLEEVEVALVRSFYVEPEPGLGGCVEAADDLVRRGRLLLAAGRDKRSHGFLVPGIRRS